MASQSEQPAIRMQNLKYSWGPNVTLLDVESFELKQGERVFLRGPSGSGKTTFLGLVGGVLIPQSGEVQVHGQSLSTLSGSSRDRFRADHIGFIFQMFNLLPYLSVLDNVTLPCRFSDRRRRRAEEAGSLESEARRLLSELGLGESDILDRQAIQLSVGQQQRVAAARALIGKPELVIADEPTSALDSDTQESFLRLLFDECGDVNASLLFVSHDMRLSNVFERALDLSEINRRTGK